MLADALLAEDRVTGFTRQEIERIAYQLYSLASKHDGYSLYTMAQMSQSGYSGLPANSSQAMRLYDQLIEGAEQAWYQYEHRYPALISKYALVARLKLRKVWSFFGQSSSAADL